MKTLKLLSLASFAALAMGTVHAEGAEYATQEQTHNTDVNPTITSPASDLPADKRVQAHPEGSEAWYSEQQRTHNVAPPPAPISSDVQGLPAKVDNDYEAGKEYSTEGRDQDH